MTVRTRARNGTAFRVRVQVTFPRHPGFYLYLCHILEHEDMGMMRNFRVT